MVTNLDVIVKKYPNIITEILAYVVPVGIYSETGEPCVCRDMDCHDCVFHDENYPNDARDCRVRITEWLKSPVRRHYIDGVNTEIEDDNRNLNGEITW